MRHVPIAEFKDRLSELVSVAAAGEAIAITRHGREVARLIGPETDAVVRRRAALARLAAIREELAQEGMRTTRDEIVAWIAEGRERR